MNRMLFLGIVMSLVGCAQTTSKYYYVSLESVEDVEILARAKLKLENLEKNSKIPTEYRFSRNKYSLTFLIGDKSYFPHLKIFVSGANGNSLALKPKRDVGIVSDDGNICASYYLNRETPSVMDFGWSISCVSENIRKEISFDIVDSSGQLVAHENIPFVVISEGEYTLLDTI